MAVARQSLQFLNKRFRLSARTLIRTRESTLKFQACQIDKRMFTTTKILSKEQMEELQKNPYFDKYAEKIAKLQKQNPEEFLARIEAKTNAGKSEASAPKEFSLPGAAKEKLQAVTEGASGKQKSLDSIVKLDLLTQKTAKEIEEIWCNHFSSKDCVSAVIPKETYNTMSERFTEFNTFLFPLPRDQGYEFIVVQFLGHEAHFTTLINYQAHKENAPECLNMVHYPELAESKGLVLMVGEYDKDVLTSTEARCLADQVELYYSRPSPSKLALMNRFTKEPTLFSHEDLIAEMNSLTLGDTAEAKN